MKFSTVAATAFAAGASALSYNNGTAPSYVTEVVTAYTTYCPGPTTIAYGGQTYTVTKATTLTITNCPCTVTRPVTTAVLTRCNTCAYTAPVAPTTPVSPPVVSPPAPYYPPSNGTVPTSRAPPAGTGAPSAVTSAPPAYTGAANKAVAASGAGLAAVLGLAAYVL